MRRNTFLATMGAALCVVALTALDSPLPAQVGGNQGPVMVTFHAETVRQQLLLFQGTLYSPTARKAGFTCFHFGAQNRAERAPRSLNVQYIDLANKNRIISSHVVNAEEIIRETGAYFEFAIPAEAFNAKALEIRASIR